MLARDLLSRLDTAAGAVIEDSVVRHHRRRLRRLGWARALEPDGGDLWAGDEPAPRAGSRLDVLVDGAEALPTIADAIAGAKEQVHITGWHLAPGFELKRGEPSVVLGSLLADMAERVDVRVLVWAGSPLPVFHPTRAEVADAIRTLTRRTRIRCEADPREHPFHCHHEKTVIVDGRVAFVGGIDHHRPGRGPLRLLGAPEPAPAGLARRGHSPRGPGGGGRPRALRDALGRGDRGAAGHTAAARPSGLEHGPGRPHGRRGHVRRCAARGLPHPRGVRARAALARSPSSTSRTSSCGRPRSSDLLADKLRDPPQ